MTAVALDLPGPSRRVVVEPLVLPEPARDPALPAEPRRLEPHEPSEAPAGPPPEPVPA